jgi:putative CocE/NonD family hydrolase
MMLVRSRTFRATLLALVAVAAPLAAQRGGRGADPAAVAKVKAQYRKLEVRIPMRDGVKLFTVIYIPRDTTKSFPFLMDRTPYGVGDPDPEAYRPSLGLGPRYMEVGMAFVYQDARGRYYSEGAYTEMTPHRDVKKGVQDVDESTDTYDTIDWLVKNVPHNNGRVGIYGTSYPGFYTTASCINPHPALKACAPGSPMTDLWNGDDLFHNGAFYLGANFSFYQGYGRTPRANPPGPDPKYDPRPDMAGDAYTFFLEMGPVGPGSRKWLPPETAPLWNLVMRHPSYDEFWQARDIRRHLKKTAPAMLEVGGFYDAEDLFGPFGTFRAIEKLSGGAGNHLAMGPWSHGGWARGDGDALATLHWNNKTGPWFRDSVEFPFFYHHLAGGPDPKLPKVLIYRTGADQWDRYDQFPPKTAVRKSLYLLEGGKLSFDAPKAGGKPYDEYVSDPANPVPVVGRKDGSGMPRDYMVGDQRFASSRTDVLTYVSDVLTADVTVAGPLTPVLHVATSGTDADFDVKFIDVWPDDAPNWPGDATGFKVAGYQQLLRGEPFRGRYRRSNEKPVAFVPNQPDSLRFTMPDINHTFRKGHRIMVQVQSSWFPLTDRNPQTFVPNIFEAAPTDFVKATMRVYHAPAKLSRVDLSVTP